MFRKVAGVVLVLSACSPIAPIDNCRVTADCPDALVCVQGLCAMPPPRDAGVERPDAGALIEEEDAGLDASVADADAGVADAGVLDAGVLVADSGVCVPSIELCNGRDDDCDGQLDEQVSFLEVDGGAVSFDGGVTAPSGMCVVGLGACQRSGIASCASGQINCSAFVGSGSNEVCNGLDDDCDGMTDEADPMLCGRMGEVCSSGSCACPMGQTACGAACVTLGDGCSVGQGACLRNGFKVCTAGAVACDVMPGTPSTESCNSVDDDCDGQTDESDPGICAATGQTCVNSTCQCPSGQDVCNGACKTLTVELCDGQDNDCNGQTDEGLTIACLADPDDDGYAAAGAAMSQQCPVGSRASRGYCPQGYVAATQNAGADCSEGDASKYRLVSSRTDADGDNACVGGATADCVGAGELPGRTFASSCLAADDCLDSDATRFRLAAVATDADNDGACTTAGAQECIGANLPSGKRLASTCTSTADCNDGNSTTWELQPTRADMDADGYCFGAATSSCVGSSGPAGRRVSSTCQATDDCDDSSASLWRIVSTRADVDADAYCAPNSMMNTCMGNTLPAGRRRSEMCATTDDCNDGNNSLYQLASVRDDADGDTWCVNAPSTMCIGQNAPSGKRLTSQCATGGDDCRDTNGFANLTCSMPAQYKTTYARKECGVGFPATASFTVTVAQACPTGFQYLFGIVGSTSYGWYGDPGGSCTPTSGTTISMSCGNLVFGAFNCRVEGECVAQ